MTPVRYDKPPLPPEQLLVHLESRGMVIVDRPLALREVRYIGYYRLKAYLHPFRLSPTQSELRPGTSIETILYYYYFDRDLRLMVFSALETLEIAIRSLLIERLTAGSDPFGHRDPRLFVQGRSPSGKVVFEHSKWISELDRFIADDENERFVRHYREKYDGFPQLPCWMALELTSFGELSRLYTGCLRSMRTEIAKVFGLNERVFGSWLHNLSHLRNICAHHARLWNRQFGITPELPETKHDARWGTARVQNRVFLRLAMVRYLLRCLELDKDWADRVERAFGVDFAKPWVAERMGFPYEIDARGRKAFLDWVQHPLWNGVPAPQVSVREQHRPRKR